MSRRRRTLRPDEEELWKKVADTATPLNPQGSLPAPIDLLNTAKPKRKPAEMPALEPFSIGQTAKPVSARYDVVPSVGEHLSQQPIQMDGKAFNRMRRGKLKPEGRIDLHGMTLAQAHPALTRFILSAHSAQKRLVLVITGKGRQGDDTGPIPQRRGALKHEVPQWLRSGALRGVVLQITEAHQKHGGAGAYYVYLRRQR